MTAAVESSATQNQTQHTCPQPGEFSWNELVTTGVEEAARFYTHLFGWKAEAFPGAMPYTLFKSGGRDVGGLMACPDPQAPPQWLAYVRVEDVAECVRKAAELGAKIIIEPKDIPGVGEIAVFQDPQGATLGVFQPVEH